MIVSSFSRAGRRRVKSLAKGAWWLMLVLAAANLLLHAGQALESDGFSPILVPHPEAVHARYCPWLAGSLTAATGLLFGVLLVHQLLIRQKLLAKARRDLPLASRRGAVGTLAAKRKLYKKGDPPALAWPFLFLMVCLAATVCSALYSDYWAASILALYALGSIAVIVLAVGLGCLALYLESDSIWRWIRSKLSGKAFSGQIPDQERRVLMARASAAGLDTTDPEVIQAMVDDYQRLRQAALAEERRLDGATAAALGQSGPRDRL